jgi:hypothetical protein
MERSRPVCSTACASDDVGVFGAAANDDNFVAGGDSVRYELDLGAASGELTVEVELLFQSIGYRWAENLKAYRSAETDRFVRYYEQSANVSAMRLATATATF